MASAEYADIILKKLEKPWSSDRILKDLSSQLLRSAADIFGEIDSEVKCRILMAFLYIPSIMINERHRSRRIVDQNFIQALHAFISISLQDSVEWVKVTAEQVINILSVEPSLNLLPEEPLVKESLFERSLLSLVETIDSDENRSENNGIGLLPSLSFLPFEYSHLSRSAWPEVLPGVLDKLSKNIHFTAVDEIQTEIKAPIPLISPRTKPYPSPVIQSDADLKRKLEDLGNRYNHNLPSASIIQHSTQKQLPQIKLLDSNGEVLGINHDTKIQDNMESLSAGGLDLLASTVPDILDEGEEINGVSAAQRSVLQEILTTVAGSKLDEEGREIILAYLRGDHFKTGTDGKSFRDNVTLLIAETRERNEPSLLKVEQTKLKIDFRQRSIKKVKAVKRFKLNASGATSIG